MVGPSLCSVRATKEAFHSMKNTGLNFRKFCSDKRNSILRDFRKRHMYMSTKIYCYFLPGAGFRFLELPLGIFLDFRVNDSSLFRNSIISDFQETFSGNFWTIFFQFRSFHNFWLNGKPIHHDSDRSLDDRGQIVSCPARNVFFLNGQTFDQLHHLHYYPTSDRKLSVDI